MFTEFTYNNTFIIVIALLLLILAFVIAFIIVKKSKKLAALDAIVLKAINDLQINEDVLEEISEEDKNTIFHKYRPLYITISSTKDISFPWRKSNFDLFKKLHISFLRRVSAHNELVQKVKLIQTQIPLAIAEINAQETRFTAFSEWEHIKNKYSQING